MKNKLNKILKISLKFFLGIFIFSISLCIGMIPKMDTSLTTPHSELVNDIKTSKEDLTKIDEEVSKAKSQKEDLEKQINSLKDSLNQTNDSISALENNNSK